MKLHAASRFRFALGAILLGLLTLGCVSAQAGDMAIEAQLLWGTNDSTSPNHEHKPVSAEVKRKLDRLPLKWSHYFEVNRIQLVVPAGKSSGGDLSDKCRIEVKSLDADHIEVSVIGKGEPVLKRIQHLSKDASLVIGGDAPDSTSWLIFLKRGQ